MKKKIEYLKVDGFRGKIRTVKGKPQWVKKSWKTLRTVKNLNPFFEWILLKILKNGSDKKFNGYYISWSVKS